MRWCTLVSGTPATSIHRSPARCTKATPIHRRRWNRMFTSPTQSLIKNREHHPVAPILSNNRPPGCSYRHRHASKGRHRHKPWEPQANAILPGSLAQHTNSLLQNHQKSGSLKPASRRFNPIEMGRLHPVHGATIMRRCKGLSSTQGLNTAARHRQWRLKKHWWRNTTPRHQRTHAFPRVYHPPELDKIPTLNPDRAEHPPRWCQLGPNFSEKHSMVLFFSSSMNGCQAILRNNVMSILVH